MQEITYRNGPNEMHPPGKENGKEDSKKSIISNAVQELSGIVDICPELSIIVKTRGLG
jgi:hypothetical protein